MTEYSSPKEEDITETTEETMVEITATEEYQHKTDINHYTMRTTKITTQQITLPLNLWNNNHKNNMKHSLQIDENMCQ